MGVRPAKDLAGKHRVQLLLSDVLLAHQREPLRQQSPHGQC